MTKDEAINLLGDFYDEMVKAEQLGYISSIKMYEQQKVVFDKYADILVKIDNLKECKWFDGGCCFNEEEFPGGVPTEVGGSYCTICNNYQTK